MSFRDYQNIVEGVGNRVNSRKENLSKREFDIKDYLEQQGANKYRNAMEKAEDKYKVAEDVFSGDLSKYQDRLLKAIGLDEEQSQAISSLVNTAGAVGVPVIGGVKSKLKSIAQQKRDKVKESFDERKKEFEEAKEKAKEKAKSKGKTEPGEKVPEEKPPITENQGSPPEEEFTNEDINEPLPEPTPEPTPVSEAGPSGIPPEEKPPMDIEMQNMGKGVKSTIKQAGGQGAEGIEMGGGQVNATDIQKKLQSQEDEAVGKEAEQIEASNAEKEASFEEAKTAFDEGAKDFGKNAFKAGAKAVAREGAEDAVEYTAEEAGELGLAGALEGAGALLGPIGIVAGLGLGIYDLGKAFHFWGDGGQSQNVGPAPTPPKPPKLEDIPKPKQIQVGAPVMNSGKYHTQTAPAGVINSSILRR